MSAPRRRGLPAALTALVLSGLGPSRASALQLGAAFDVGTGPVAWDHRPGATALTLAPSLAFASPRYRLTADGALSNLGPLGWSTRGTAGVSAFPGIVLGLRAEIAGSLAVSAHPAARGSLRWDLLGRLATRDPARGAWIGGGAGRATSTGPPVPFTRLEAGGWARVAMASVRLWVVRTGFADRVLREGVFFSPQDPRQDTLFSSTVAEYTDVGSRIALAGDRYDLAATLARRLGSRPFRTTAWHLDATWWLRPDMGIVAAAGQAFPELAAALPGGRYTTLGVRLALGSRGAPPVRRRLPPPRRDAARTLLAERRRVILLAPDVGRVEIMGDFTDWTAKALRKDGAGRWVYPERLAPGVHQLNVRFDGGAWTVPAGATPMDDGFGGRVGLFVVR